MGSRRGGLLRAEEALMAKLHSEVLEEATNKIRQNEVLEARVRELSEKLRWSEAERVQLEEERVREVQEHAALKREYRDLKNMMVDNISKITALEEQLAAERRKTVAVAGVAGLPEPSLTETRHSASSASTPNFEPPVRVWERVPSVDALEGTSFMDEDISVVAALEISPVHKRMHAANARASPPRASPGRGRRADAAQQLRWDADSGGRSPPAGRPSPRARVDEVFLSDSELDDDDDRPAAPPAPAFARRASPLPLPPPPATAAAAAAAAATRDGAQPIYESSEPRPAAADALGLSAPAAEPGVAGVQRAQWGGAAGRVARDQEPPELLRVWATRSRRAEGGVRAPGEGGKEGRDVSGQYGKRDETCPVSTGGGEAEVSGLPSGLITSPLMVA